MIDKGNGKDPHSPPALLYPQVVDVPPGSTVLVVPIDGLKAFVQALSREYLGPNTEFFIALIRHVELLPTEP